MARTKAKSAWMRRHVNDPYVQRAQAEGYRSRAAYKLLQIAAREHLLAPGMTVIDLGAAPGGWSQVAAAAVAPGGRVIAVDRLAMEPVAGVTFVRGDFHEPGTLAEVVRLLAGKRADLVLSDLSPNISGIASLDQARAAALAELAWEFTVNYLKPEGNFLIKAFQGSDFDAFLRQLRQRFRQVRVRKPEASRSGSREVYLLAQGLKPD
ncbi:MAG: 23S rRNA methyltransferase [Betaproteobacteria bacterium RIFCSPLOWO2_02_64_14]|nr:MAG: 23S rRNA methyltransferase [Betaproteobacteria bacterium RIFCSPLOWO2_02_64_14]HLE66812.1 RlmE family RNA methyltransferase [Burkholderiales bacterium]